MSHADTIHEQAHELYLRTAESLAREALSAPGSVGGRGSVLEADLAVRVLALVAENQQLRDAITEAMRWKSGA